MTRRRNYPLELGGVLAFGLATAWWSAQRPWAISFREDVYLVLKLQQHVEPFLSGTALAGGIGLWWERRRRRSPVAWGVGRWTWSVAALAAAFEASMVPMNAASSWWRLGRSGFFPWAALRYVRSSMLMTFSGLVGWAFAAAWVASRITGCPIDPAPDGRERAGRIFLVAIVAWTVGYHAILVFS